jgi:hypothetical protein
MGAPANDRNDHWEATMGYRDVTCAAALVAACWMPFGALAFDDAQYPNLKGEWRRVAVDTGIARVIQYDPTKQPGRAQEAPLTPEYQAIFEANFADHATGGQAGDATALCMSPGMPRIMGAYAPMEIVVTPETTYILIEHIHDSRRIYTDGRDFPTGMAEDPQFAGYSIGRWADEDGDGRYDTLVVETRGLKGPRAYEATGLELHADNQSIIRERIYLDKSEPNTLHDEITTIDHALTRPWTVTKTYRRGPTGKPIWWREDVCAENNVHVAIGKEVYFLSADGQLMPAKRDQAAPDLRYFNKARK